MSGTDTIPLSGETIPLSGEQVPHSPEYIRPVDVMRRRLLRKREEQACQSQLTGNNGAAGRRRRIAAASSKGQGQRRVNPFGQVNNEDGVGKPTSATSATSAPDEPLFRALDRKSSVEIPSEIERPKRKGRPEPFEEPIMKKLHGSTGKSLVPGSLYGGIFEPVSKPILESGVVFPCSWVLGSRVKFTFTEPCDWLDRVRPIHGCRGIARQLESSNRGVDDEILTKNSSRLPAKLQEAISYWISLPRCNVPDHKFGNTSAGYLTKTLIEGIRTSWEDSFRSAFWAVMSGHSPYFYFLAQSFTVLFRAANLGGATGVTAIVTPTVRGFRKAMKDEGVEFSLPLQHMRQGDKSASTPSGATSKKTSSPTYSSEVTDMCVKREKASDSLSTCDKTSDSLSQCEMTSDSLSKCEKTPDSLSDCEANEQVYDDDDEEVDDDDDLEPSIFIESLGLNTDLFPLLRPSQVSSQREGFQSIDGRPESTALIDPSSIMNFFNFLLNYPGTIGFIGAQAGVTPTFISTVPFDGAQLAKNKYAYNEVFDTDSHTSRQRTHRYMLDVLGPITPLQLYKLCSMQRAQGSFSVSITPVETTAQFNVSDTAETSNSNNSSSSGKNSTRANEQPCKLDRSESESSFLHHTPRTQDVSKRSFSSSLSSVSENDGFLGDESANQSTNGGNQCLENPLSLSANKNVCLSDIVANKADRSEGFASVQAAMSAVPMPHCKGARKIDWDERTQLYTWTKASK